MIILREKTGTLDALHEMSYPCKKNDGYGMIIQINSDDHGTIGNNNSPAHAHLLTTGGQEIAEFQITERPPRSPADIAWYRTKSIPDGYAVKIVRWAKDKNKAGFNNWASLKYVWTIRKPQ